MPEEKYIVVALPEGKKLIDFCEIIFLGGKCDQCIPHYNPCPLSTAKEAVRVDKNSQGYSTVLNAMNIYNETIDLFAVKKDKGGK